MSAPKYHELFNPLLRGLRELGGSASIAELEDTVSRGMGLNEADATEIHKGNQSKFSYNLAWARTYLKRYGLLENSARGVWALNELGLKTETVVPEEVIRSVQEEDRAARAAEEDSVEEPETAQEARWQDAALVAVKGMAPEAFERLCQRLLRESGFIQVEVTGRSGDGGIDGRGVVKLGGILSFHVIFQCKRYKESVGAGAIRDFRGAMVGRADKGLFITTGVFTRDARLEAQRDGAPPLDLIDGDELILMLKEMQLGVHIRQKIIEEITVDMNWFATF